MDKQILYNDKDIEFERFDDGKYRLTFFNDNHWAGDIMFSKKDGVIYDDVKDNELKINTNSKKMRESIKKYSDITDNDCILYRGDSLKYLMQTHSGSEVYQFESIKNGQREHCFISPENLIDNKLYKCFKYYRTDFNGITYTTIAILNSDNDLFTGIKFGTLLETRAGTPVVFIKAVLNENGQINSAYVANPEGMLYIVSGDGKVNFGEDCDNDVIGKYDMNSAKTVDCTMCQHFDSEHKECPVVNYHISQPTLCCHYKGKQL